MSAANPVARKNAPKVDLDTTRERLTRLGLAHASEHVGETLAEAAKESWPAHRFLDRLLEAELTVREERRMKTSLRLSGLPTGQTLGNFDYVQRPIMWSLPVWTTTPWRNGWLPTVDSPLRFT